MAYDLQADIRELENMLRRLETAENSGNHGDIGEMLAEDAVIMVPNQPVQQGKVTCTEFVREVLTGVLEEYDRNIAYSSDEVRTLGDWAFDRGTFSFTISPKAGGEATRECGKYLFIYARSAGSTWKMWRAMVNLDEQEDKESLDTEEDI